MLLQAAIIFMSVRVTINSFRFGKALMSEEPKHYKETIDVLRSIGIFDVLPPIAVSLILLFVLAVYYAVLWNLFTLTL